MDKKILLSHGAGGQISHKLIRDFIIREINNDILIRQTDSAILNINKENIAFTTDSYVVDPIFFPGGDIGKLAVCGTVNDLAVSGAVPKYLSLAFILEEGFSMNEFKQILQSIGKAALESNVKIVTGDTKVVNKGKADKIFINTAGIGEIDKRLVPVSFGEQIRAGDIIIINGTIGDHGIAVLSAREKLNINPPVLSDCAPLNDLVSSLISNNIRIKFMRDATRGGLATVLNEIADERFGVDIDENKIKVRENVRGICEMMGFDPLYLANEGKIVFIIDKNDEHPALEIIRKHKYGKDAETIAEITEEHPNLVVMKTVIGGKRIVDMLAGEQLPRIC